MSVNVRQTKHCSQNLRVEQVLRDLTVTALNQCQLQRLKEHALLPACHRCNNIYRTLQNKPTLVFVRLN